MGSISIILRKEPYGTTTQLKQYAMPWRATEGWSASLLVDGGVNAAIRRQDTASTGL